VCGCGSSVPAGDSGAVLTGALDPAFAPPPSMPSSSPDLSVVPVPHGWVQIGLGLACLVLLAWAVEKSLRREE
jgi:hypothetical protein